MKKCGNSACDGGFVWVSDRWARHMAGIPKEMDVSEMDELEWNAYRTRLHTVTMCTSCRGRPDRPIYA